MGFKEVIYNNKVYKDPSKIHSILLENNLYWLIDSEIDNAIIEIKKSTVIWLSGNYIYGDWHYGIFKNGGFYGNWLNGIFEDGHFAGNWVSGIKK